MHVIIQTTTEGTANRIYVATVVASIMLAYTSYMKSTFVWLA